jgi:hypothetical protein
VNPVRKGPLDPTFIYRNAANTDVRPTFERVRRDQARRETDATQVVRMTVEGNARAVNALRNLAKVTC